MNHAGAGRCPVLTCLWITIAIVGEIACKSFAVAQSITSGSDNELPSRETKEELGSL